ncbi:MAG TPA: TRAP transporter large permease [Nannocystaceae bacterium]|nr:TRAP transporter large permease [Nannocystaceae bacterium]
MRGLSPLGRMWLALALVAIGWLAFAALGGDGNALAAGPAADPDDVETSGAGSLGALVLIVAVFAMIALGSPLFVILGVLAALLFLMYAEGYDDLGSCTTLDPQTICGYDSFPASMAELSTKNVLLAIPFFVVSGAIMSAGDIANRLVAFARALVGWMPGGLAVAAVGGCIFFAAISGSSPVTVIAIGSIMYPALIKAGYQSRFSLGLVSSAGSLGIVIPPSIPMLVFAIVASGTITIDVSELFLAGVLPGLLIGALLAAYAVFHSLRSGTSERVPFSWGEVGRTFREGFWAILLPVLILGGIYSLFTPTEAAAVSVVYALIVELFIHRQLGMHHMPKILVESAVMMGSLLVIMALAFGLNHFLVLEQIPDAAVELIRSWDLGVVEFLLVLNGLLLIAGALMDSISAIMIIAPLLTPVAIKLGIDPIHLGIIFIVNLEIGYLTPPIGLNLFVASSVFEKPIGEVIKSVVPYILVMMVGLVVVTYVPSLALGPVNVLMRNKPFSEGAGMPGTKPAQRADAPVILAPGEGEGEHRVKAMAEMTLTSKPLVDMCNLAEDINDESPTVPDRPQAWLDDMAATGVTDPTAVALAKKAAAAAGSPAAYKDFQSEASRLLKTEWECEPLEELLATKPTGPNPPRKVGKPDDEAEDEDE